MVVVPAVESVPAAMSGVVVLLTLLNPKLAPPLVPTVSVAGVTCVPLAVTVSDAPSATAMLPEPVFAP